MSDFIEAQAKADPVYRAFGDSAGAPHSLNGESLQAYRQRLAGKVQKHSAEWKSVDLSKLPEQVLSIAESSIYCDALAAANSGADLGNGELRMITDTDPYTRAFRHRFVGDDGACWAQFMNPCHLIGRVNTSIGRV